MPKFYQLIVIVKSQFLGNYLYPINCLITLLLSAEAREEIQHELYTTRNEYGLENGCPLSRQEKLGASSTLLRELVLEDPTAYKNILRMDPKNFDELLGMDSSAFQKKILK